MAYAFVIEDDPDSARLLRAALESANVDSDIIMQGRQAMDRLRHETPDLVLLDMNLPQTNGVEIVKFIRQQPHLQNTRIIVVSGDAEMSEYVEDTVDFVLLKPISIPQLIAIVERIL